MRRADESVLGSGHADVSAQHDMFESQMRSGITLGDEPYTSLLPRD
jgi:hypothetical protein